jgi:hypothetical protein
MKQTAKDRKEFAAYVRGDHPDVKSYQRYVLAQLRCARLRARLLMNEIDAIGVALASGAIDAEAALDDLAGVQALDFLIQSEPPWQRPEDLATVAADSQGVVDAQESQTPTGA